jgi:hypothetical protein
MPRPRLTPSPTLLLPEVEAEGGAGARDLDGVGLRLEEGTGDDEGKGVEERDGELVREVVADGELRASGQRHRPPPGSTIVLLVANHSCVASRGKGCHGTDSRCPPALPSHLLLVSSRALK